MTLPLSSAAQRRGGELYLAWTLCSASSEAAQQVRDRLAMGEEQKLYRLSSWVVTDSSAQALLQPAAPLEQIAAALWTNPPELNRARWISDSHARVELTREIETAPVRMGLARRPEEWPYSSAAQD